jgi:CubicO group peptidase (beta-lactamase class C family)
LMQKYSVPGGAVAVMRDGKLVLARGYGFADNGQ